MSKSERADDLFILETLRHWRNVASGGKYPTGKTNNCLLEDTKRCIKILEDRKK